MKTSRIEGHIVDISAREIYEGSITISDGVITQIQRHKTDEKGYIMPGFIDSHVHIESSMLTPENFGRLALRRGTVSVVTDPHEIANVMGKDGIRFMIESSKLTPLKISFTLPSCVPATPFDISGSVITSSDIEELASTGEFIALSEVMNVPGVLSRDPEVMAKLDVAKRYNIPIDGHAPLLSGESLGQYIQSGISTDHEASNIDEALEKISLGMKILIREGSAARNYTMLRSLIKRHTNSVMFCTDDSHPDEILELGHIDKIVRMAISDGYDLYDVLQIACFNPVDHYKLNVGRLREGESADFIVVDNLEQFTTQRVYIDGVEVYCSADKEQCTPTTKVEAINNFYHADITINDLCLPVNGSTKVIGVADGDLITTVMDYGEGLHVDNFESDLNSDILKIVYINRYNNGKPQVALCSGFKLNRGALASTVGHDSHNIIAIGCSDEELVSAINAVISKKGGLSVVCDGGVEILELPIAGIMSDDVGERVAESYKKLNTLAKEIGCSLKSPFMTLSFLSLVVIPEIKIGEKGLFLYDKFGWI